MIATPARVRTLLVCAVAVMLVGQLPAQTQFKVVHTFSAAAPENGAFPSSGPLAETADGSVYGITDSGGEFGQGTVFRMTDGVVTPLASFNDDTGIPAVASGLLLASDGDFYGLSETGTDPVTGEIFGGTVFRVTPDGSVFAWARFTADVGATPSGRLIEGSDGYLYGTALFSAGGEPGFVFRVKKASGATGELGVVEVFATLALDPVDGSAPAGAFPSAGVTEVTPGVFYGTAEMGGANGFGSIFQATAGSVSAVHSFTNSEENRDGSMPASPLLMIGDGVSAYLYGTTTGGGATTDDLTGYPGSGTLFRLALDGTNTLTTLASFDSALTGEFPYQQGLTQVGDYLYGTTQIGGAPTWGTVYRWSETAGLELVHPLDGITAMMPTNTLLKAADGTLYGAGLGPEGGIIFSLEKDAEVQSSLAVAPATAIYGGSATLSAALSSAGEPIADAEITFKLNGVAVGSAMTGANGIASLAGVPVTGINAGSYPGAIEASFAGAANLLAVTATGDLTIDQATPAISIADATHVYDGQPHPALATVTGVQGEDLGALTLAYSSGGAPVEPGTYSVTASYAGSLNYRSASATAAITILVAPAGLDGLIAAYGFDEGAGRIAGDASGKGHAGDIKQAAWSTAGRFGGALDFDGINDWVTIEDTADLDIRDAITLEAWVNPRSLSGWNTILLKEASTGLAYSLYANDFYPLHPAGYLNVGGSSDVSVVDTTALPLNAWSHVAMTYDGAMMRLYINGHEAGRRALTGRIIASNRQLRIGGNEFWGEFFNGRIDEVRVYARALQSAEIARDMHTPIAHEGLAPTVSITSPADGAVVSGTPVVTVSATDNLAISSVQLQVNGVDSGTALAGAPYSFKVDAANGTVVLRAVARDVAGNVAMSAPVTIKIANTPVADYRFNEGSGTTVLDASGHNNNGSMNSGVTRVSDATRGQVLSFNGSNGMVTIADANSLDLTTGITLEAWVRPTSVDGWRTVILKEVSGGLSYSLYANDDDADKPAGYVRIDSVEEKVRGKKRLTANAWAHIAMTYDGTTMRFYLNGEEVESRKQAGAAEVSNGKLRIGGNQVWGEWFRGQIDDVRVYDVAVGAAQIKADMK